MSTSVISMPACETESWLLNRHYARRLCPISYAFGAYRGAELIGVVTYGTPASSPLRGGVCGPEWSDKVIELNRLCCENSRNVASTLVGRSLRLLPRPSVVVSYADTAQGHVGYIYQATNFIYTGLSAKRTDWKIKGREHLHGATVADESRGQENRAEWMRAKYGDNFYLERNILLFGGLDKERGDQWIEARTAGDNRATAEFDITDLLFIYSRLIGGKGNIDGDPHKRVQAESGSGCATKADLLLHGGNSLGLRFEGF